MSSLYWIGPRKTILISWDIFFLYCELMVCVDGGIELHLVMIVMFHSEIHGDWYLLHPGSTGNISMAKIGDGDEDTCDGVDLADHSKLLKTTLPASYSSLDAYVGIKEPEVNFLQERDCDTGPSVLMTHDSSKAISNGLDCKPFCEVPNACQLVNLIGRFKELIKYQFSCQCSNQSCNDLFFLIQPERPRMVVKICHVYLRYNWVEVQN